jgi:hypothetical protein
VPIEEDFTNTLRAELSSCEPDLLVILADGVRRGRRRRRRRAAVLSGAAVLLAGGLVGALSPSLTHPTGAPRPDMVVAVPSMPPPHTPLPSASPSLAAAQPWAWSATAVDQRLLSLLPSGITVTQGPSPDPASGAVTYFQLDDGGGACWLAISAQQLAGTMLAQQRRLMATGTTGLADGTRVVVRQIPAQAGVAPSQQVSALMPDGMDVEMTLSSASYPNRTSARSSPILTADQLTTIATSPQWETGQ